MRKLFALILSLFVFETQAQDMVMPGKLAVGLTFSPDYAYRTLRSDPNSQWISDSRDDLEIPKLGFTTGARVLYTLGNRVGLETGLLFADKGEKTKEINYTLLEPEMNAPQSAKHNHHYYFLDVPVKVNYYAGLKKVKLFVSAGTAVNFFLSQKRSSVYTMADGSTKKEEVTETLNANQISLSVIAGAGAEYALTNRLFIRVEPVYRRSVASLTSTPIESNLYSFGTNFGLFLSL